MNKLSGIISHVQTSGAIMLVDIDINGQDFSALLIESINQSHWLQIGNFVDLVFKETEVSLAKNLSGQISMRNKMASKVIRIERGDLLSVITLQFKTDIITSAITTRSVDALHISIGDDIVALVKANEISLMKKS